MSENKSGIYLYAIVSAERARALPPFPNGGIGAGEVYAITENDLAAVVSRTEQQRLRPERRHLGAHQAVLKILAATDTALPVSFGIIAATEEAVRTILRRHKDRLTEQLEHVAGKVEMGLRIAWDVPNIFEYFVSRFSDLQAARSSLVENGQGTRDGMIAIGQMFESHLNDERDHAFERVAEVLKRHDIEIKRNPTRAERDVANIACLVKREQQEFFEAVVGEAALGFDNAFLFDFNGPWSPHNFVDVRLTQPD